MAKTIEEIREWVMSFCNNSEQIEETVQSLEGADVNLEDIDINAIVQNSYWSEDALFDSV